MTEIVNKLEFNHFIYIKFIKSLRLSTNANERWKYFKPLIDNKILNLIEN